MTTQKSRPLVAVIGGTISTLARDRFDYVEYADGAAKLDVNSLLELVPEVAEQAEIRRVSFSAVSSSKIAPRDWLELNDLVHRVAAVDVPPHGIVIIHGTSTLEKRRTSLISGPGGRSRFVSWNPQGSSPVCSVDGLPGMTEQSGKRLESVPSPFS